MKSHATKQQCYKGGFSGFSYNDEGLESDLKSRPIDKYVNKHVYCMFPKLDN